MLRTYEKLSWSTSIKGLPVDWVTCPCLFTDTLVITKKKLNSHQMLADVSEPLCCFQTGAFTSLQACSNTIGQWDLNYNQTKNRPKSFCNQKSLWSVDCVHEQPGDGNWEERTTKVVFCVWELLRYGVLKGAARVRPLPKDKLEIRRTLKRRGRRVKQGVCLCWAPFTMGVFTSGHSDFEGC